MKLDGEKLKTTLHKVRAAMVEGVRLTSKYNDEHGAVVYTTGKSTIDNVIELIESGDYTIEDKG